MSDDSKAVLDELVEMIEFDAQPVVDDAPVGRRIRSHFRLFLILGGIQLEWKLFITRNFTVEPP